LGGLVNFIEPSNEVILILKEEPVHQLGLIGKLVFCEALSRR